MGGGGVRKWRFVQQKSNACSVGHEKLILFLKPISCTPKDAFAAFFLYSSMWMVLSATLANSIICQFSEIEMIVLTFKFKMKSYGVTSEMKHSLQLCHLVLSFGHN